MLISWNHLAGLKNFHFVSTERISGASTEEFSNNLLKNLWAQAFVILLYSVRFASAAVPEDEFYRKGCLNNISFPLVL